MKAVYAQAVLAVAAVFAGAWLIGLWAVGVVLVVAGVLAGLDVLLRNHDRWEPGRLPRHEDVLERWRRSR